MKVKRAKLLSVEYSSDKEDSTTEGDDEAAAREFTAAPTVAMKVSPDSSSKARDITSIADKIERGGRFDLLQFYLGESDSSDIGLDVTSLEQMSNWRCGSPSSTAAARGKERPKKKLVSASRTRRIAEKIEKNENDRSDLLNFYLGETDLLDIGIDLEDMDEFVEWKTATRGKAEARRRTSNDIAENIVRHEDDRIDSIRCYTGELSLLQLGVREADVESFLSKFVDGPAKVGGARAKFAVDVAVDEDDGDDAAAVTENVDRVIAQEVPALIGPELTKHILNPQA